MRHVFRATKMGWSKEQEGVWFDSSHYTKDEAKAQFQPYQGTTKDGYPYTGWKKRLVRRQQEASSQRP